MEDVKREKQNRSRRGGIFPFLAFFLAVFTLVAALLDLSPDRALKSAIQNTKKDWNHREEALVFLSRVLREGSVRVEGESFDLKYDADLPGEAALRLAQGDVDLELYAGEDELVWDSRALLDSPLSGKRDDAAKKIEESALGFCQFPEEQTLSLLRAYLALTDPDLLDGELSSALSRVGSKLFGSAKREKGDFLVEGEKLRATKISYLMEKENFTQGLAALQKEGRKEEVQNSVLAMFTALNALTGTSQTLEDRDAIQAFLKGEGERYASFARALEGEDSRGEAVFWIRSGRLIGMEWSFHLEGITASLSLCLGQSIKGSEESRLQWQYQRNGEEPRSVTLSHRIVEDSKKACIREVEWNLSGQEGKIRYSWGKTKGDLGLRLITAEKEIAFRGQMKEYKKGKFLCFQLSGVEENRENCLSSPLTFTLTRKGQVPAAPEAKGDLFPKGEEKQRLRESISERSREKNIGGA